MTPERHQQIAELYWAALEIEPEARAGFLAQACAGDEALRREVESLLAAEAQAGAFIAAPALHDAVRKEAVEQAPTLTRREKIGHYLIKSLLGAGGMGEVYLAQDMRLGRQVALKLLSPEMAHNPTARQRLLREARSASALNHPNIITIYSIEEADDLAFIVMEYVQGETLLARIERRELDFIRLLEIGAQIAEALAAAHAAGLIHRDIKPANVLITRAGQVKLLDFGIAKMTSPLLGEEGQETATLSQLTAEGAIIGTVAYMSPEQLRGKPLDGRTDIFSLGTVLYQAATGKLPFGGANALAIMHQIANSEPPPPSALRPGLPQEYDAIIKLALAKERRARYAAAAELAQALRRLKDQAREFLAGVTANREAGKVKSRNEAFVGREPELKRLEEILQQTLTGAGNMVFITGEPGIGKTALADEFVQRARQQVPGLLYSRGQCVEQYGAGEAYLPFLDALGALLSGPRRNQVYAALRQQAPTWCVQFPAAIVSDDSLEHLQQETIGATKERMLREIGNALEELANQSPLALLLEDLHWADAPTIDLLRHLCQRIGDQRLLIVGTFRPADLEISNHPLKSYKLEMKTHELCEEIELGLLSREHIASYLDTRFAPNDFPPEFAALIQRKTEGHPLFVTSLAQFLAERGDIAQVNGHWTLQQPPAEMELETPESVRSMIRKKLEALDEEDLRTLQYASIEGEEFLSTVLAGLLAVDDLELEERLDRIAKIHRLIVTLGEAELPDGTLAMRYRFAHALYQNALYNELVSKRRMRLHRQAGEQLLKHYGAHVRRIAAQLARHFELGRDFARAVEYRIQTGKNAARIYAFAEAKQHYSQALDRVSKLPAAAQADLYAHIYHQRGAANIALNRLSEAEEDFNQMLAQARALGSLKLEHAALRELAQTLFFAHRVEEMMDAARESLQIAERAGSEALRAESLVLFAHKNSCYGELAEAEAVLDEVIRVAGALEHKPALMGGYCWRAQMHFFRSEYERSDQLFAQATELAAELRDGFMLLSCLFYQGLTKGNLGKISEALASLNKALDMMQRNSHLAPAAKAYNGLGWLYRELQCFDQAVKYDQLSAEVAREYQVQEAETNSLLNLGFDYLHQAESAKAISALGEAAALLKRDVWHSWRFNIRLQAGSCKHWLAQGELDQAEEHARRLLETATDYTARKYIAIAHRLLAEIAEARGELAQSEAELQVALDLLQQYPTPIEAWKTRAALGRLHQRAGNARASRTAFAQAEAMVREIAAQVHEEDLRAAFLNSAAVQEIREGARQPA